MSFRGARRCDMTAFGGNSYEPGDLSEEAPRRPRSAHARTIPWNRFIRLEKAHVTVAPGPHRSSRDRQKCNRTLDVIHKAVECSMGTPLGSVMTQINLISGEPNPTRSVSASCTELEMISRMFLP